MPKITKGVYKEEVIKDKHPNNPPKGEPYCTRSQYIRYLDDNGFIASAHRYLRKDGTIGASGLPDPNRIFYNKKILAYREYRSKKTPPCK